MKKDIILASNSEIRKQLLRNAGVSFKVDIPSIDETSIKESLEAEDIKIKEIVQILSDMKATNRSNIWQKRKSCFMYNNSYIRSKTYNSCIKLDAVDIC